MRAMDKFFCQAFFLVICNPKFRNGSLEAKVGDAPAGVHIHKVGGRADVAEEVIVAEKCGLWNYYQTVPSSASDFLVGPSC